MSKTDRMSQSGVSPGELERGLANIADRLLSVGYAVIKVDDVQNDWERKAIINVSNEQNRKRKKYARQQERKVEADANKQRGR